MNRGSKFLPKSTMLFTKVLTLQSQEELSADKKLMVIGPVKEEKDIEDDQNDEVDEEEEDGEYTPAGTSTLGDEFDLATIYPSIGDAVACPWPGQTFVIRLTLTKEIITLEDGKLVLRSGERNSDRGSHWHCEENESLWLGFRNAVSGTYIGHNSRGICIATAKEHLGWESFCTRQRQDGAHVLLVKNGDGFLPLAVMRFQHLPFIFNRSTDLDLGASWEFIRVSSK